jgi:hypothetical protein
MESRKHPLYLMRLAAKPWLSFVHMPSVIERYRSADFALFCYSEDHSGDLERKYSEALSVFRANLHELADVLKSYAWDESRVLFIFHPHFQHLRPNTEGRVWNDLVSSSIEKICMANNFFFFNATETMKQCAGAHPDDFYWRVGDMHFSFKGLQEYSTVVHLSWHRL